MKKYPMSVFVIKGLLFVGIIIFVIGYGITLAYGKTEVILIRHGDKVYADIKNGWSNADCRNEKGEKLIAPSRWFGGWFRERWLLFASVDATTKGHLSILSCKEYDVLGSNPETIMDFVRL